MVMDTINAGSKYPSTLRDKDGDLLDGSKSYKLHLPAGIPAKAFWAVTIYNPADGTMPETAAFPSRNQMDRCRRMRTARLTSISARPRWKAWTRRTGFRR